MEGGCDIHEGRKCVHVSMCSDRMHLSKKDIKKPKLILPGRTRKPRGTIRCDIIQCMDGKIEAKDVSSFSGASKCQVDQRWVGEKIPMAVELW